MDTWTLEYRRGGMTGAWRGTLTRFTSPLDPQALPLRRSIEAMGYATRMVRGSGLVRP